MNIKLMHGNNCIVYLCILLWIVNNNDFEICFKWTFYFHFHLLPLDKWDLCKTGSLNVHSWAIKVIVNRRFWINYIMMKKKRKKKKLWAVLDTTVCDKVCQWLATGWWCSAGTPVSSINKPDSHDITEILLKVAFNTISQTWSWIIAHMLLNRHFDIYSI
jgi:hypothetical protein